MSIKSKSVLKLFIIVAGFLFCQGAMADDWGCEVLLCLSDPRGSMTESECKPPIEKLWRHLAKGGSFPTCALAGDAEKGTGSFARQMYDYYDPCPEGMKPAEKNSYVAQGTVVSKEQKGNAWGSDQQYNIIGPVGQSEVTSGENSNIPGARACVGNAVGSYHIGSYDDGYTVVVYDKVIWQKPQSPRAIDIYINGRMNTRVHW